MRFALFGNTRLSNNHDNELSLFALFKKFGDEVLIEESYLNFLTENLDGQFFYTGVITDNNFSADVVISIGGDGTFLRTAERVGSKGIPMLGINTGRLGFLADISANDMTQAVMLIHNGNYNLEKRSLLKIGIKCLPKGFSPYALNDISVLKHDISSMISIKTAVNGEPLITYLADGLVVATPTGSTAYSLSIGGPLIDPGTNVIELTPVAPHSLTMRPLVLQNNKRITLNIESRSKNFLVSIDGRSFSCQEDETINICRAPFRLNLLRPSGYDFFSTLRDKMKWGADCRI